MYKKTYSIKRKIKNYYYLIEHYLRKKYVIKRDDNKGYDVCINPREANYVKQKAYGKFCLTLYQAVKNFNIHNLSNNDLFGVINENETDIQKLHRTHYENTVIKYKFKVHQMVQIKNKNDQYLYIIKHRFNTYSPHVENMYDLYDRQNNFINTFKESEIIYKNL